MVGVDIQIIIMLTTLGIFKEVWCEKWYQSLTSLASLVLAYGNTYDTWKFSPSILCH